MNARTKPIHGTEVEGAKKVKLKQYQAQLFFANQPACAGAAAPPRSLPRGSTHTTVYYMYGTLRTPVRRHLDRHLDTSTRAVHLARLKLLQAVHEAQRVAPGSLLAQHDLLCSITAWAHEPARAHPRPDYCRGHHFHALTSKFRAISLPEGASLGASLGLVGALRGREGRCAASKITF